MRKTERSVPAHAGMALVEVALIVPLLALLLVGLIEVGRYGYFSIVVANAAHAGAQYGAFSAQTAGDTGSAGGIVAAAKADGQNNIKAIQATAQDVCACWNSRSGTESPAPPTAAACGQVCTSGRNVTYVKVNTTGTFNAMFDYPSLPSSFTVSSQAIMRVHQ